MRTFPKPDGKYSIGCFDGDFSDYGLEVGYRCFYPAADADCEAVTYLTGEMQSAFRRQMSANPLSTIEFMDVLTNCRMGARPADGVFRVLTYQPCMASVPWSNLLQIEELVSLGYVVFALNHPGDTIYCKIGGRARELDLESYGRLMSELIKGMIPGKSVFDWTPEELEGYMRAAELPGETVSKWRGDITSALDCIEKLCAAENFPLCGRLDVSGFGAFGGSLGGAASVAAGLYDRRIKAAINIDGFQLGCDLLDHVAATPSVYITKFAGHYKGNYGEHNPNVECIEIEGSSNLFMADWSFLAEDMVKQMDQPVPTLTGEEMRRELNAAVVGFFGKYM